MLLSQQEKEGEEVEYDLNSILNELTQTIITNNITKYNSTGNLVLKLFNQIIKLRIIKLI